MCGKLFFLVVVCASLVQVWGNPNKDEKIKAAVAEVSDIMSKAYWDTNDFTLYSGFTLDEHKAKKEKYFEQATTESQNLRNVLNDIALFLKNEAKASSKPQSVFLCIDEARETFTEKVKKLTTKHKTDILAEQLVFNEKGIRINRNTKILYQAVCYEKGIFSDRIVNSKEIKDVDRAVTYYGTWWRQTIYTFLQKMQNDLSASVKSFDENVARYVLGYRTEMESIRSNSSDEMCKCLYLQQRISGKSTLQNLIVSVQNQY